MVFNIYALSEGKGFWGCWEWSRQWGDSSRNQSGNLLTHSGARNPFVRQASRLVEFHHIWSCRDNGLAFWLLIIFHAGFLSKPVSPPFLHRMEMFMGIPVALHHWTRSIIFRKCRLVAIQWGTRHKGEHNSEQEPFVFYFILLRQSAQYVSFCPE